MLPSPSSSISCLFLTKKNNDEVLTQRERKFELLVLEQGLKGKIVEVVQKGYMLNDKVIRYAKVVIGD